MSQRDVTIENLRKAVLNPAVVTVSADAVRALLVHHDKLLHARDALRGLLESDGTTWPAWAKRSRENIDAILELHTKAD